MTDPSLIIPKKKRYPNGIIQAYSRRHKRMMWGWDFRIGDKRHRICKYETREIAETELAIEKAKADCERHGLSIDDATSDMSKPLWDRFETLLELKIGAVGATAELLVCADLLRRGFEVYRAVASNAECDLIAAKDKRLCRIEVKSAVVRNGVTRFARGRFNPLLHDVLALCFIRDCHIEYRPPIESWFSADLKPN